MKRTQDQRAVTGAITIRKLGASDADALALERLAGRDTREVPAGALLVAETEGALLAAISLATGEVIADPFTRTDELRSLLELRAAQIRRREVNPDRRIVHRRQPARGALASSPPGAGGRLISLPRWG